MSAKKNNINIQEGEKDHDKEAAEDTKVTLQGDDEFDGGEEEFEAACEEDIAFDRACTEESAERVRFLEGNKYVRI